jgi:hypothetical protein
MAEERWTAPCSNGDKDEFSILYPWERVHVTRFGFISTMGKRAEVSLPAAEGPGVGADQEAAVEKYMKAATFLMLAMPDSQIVKLWCQESQTQHRPMSQKPIS